MMGVGEHVYRLQGFYFIGFSQEGEVPGLGGGVAADVDYAWSADTEEGFYQFGVHARTGWIGDDHVGPAMLGKEVFGADITYVSGVEFAVRKAVEVGIYCCVGYCIGHGLYAYYLAGTLAAEYAYAAGTAIKVV